MYKAVTLAGGICEPLLTCKLLVFLCVSFLNVYQFVSVVLSLWVSRVGCCDLSVLVPDHCLFSSPEPKARVSY